MEVHNYIGIAGAALIVIAYLQLQLGRIESTSSWYSVSNAAGAALILLSLYFDFNLSAVVIEGFWLAISLYGVGAALSRNKKVANQSGGE